MTTFRLEGFPDLERALEDIAKRSTRIAVTRRALSLAAQPMLSKAKLYAPIDEGDLEKSIKISTRATGEVGNAAYHRTIKTMAKAAKAAGESFSLDNAKGFAVMAMRDARRAFRAVNPPAILYMGPAREACPGLGACRRGNEETGAGVLQRRRLDEVDG